MERFTIYLLMFLFSCFEKTRAERRCRGSSLTIEYELTYTADINYCAEFSLENRLAYMRPCQQFQRPHSIFTRPIFVIVAVFYFHRPCEEDSRVFFIFSAPSHRSIQTHLLEDALRTERAENQRLRVARDNRRRSWDVPGGSGEQQPRAPPRRRNSGEYEHVHQVRQAAMTFSGGMCL